MDGFNNNMNNYQNQQMNNNYNMQQMNNNNMHQMNMNTMQNAQRPDYNSQMHNYMMDNFRPLVPVTVHKDYITTMVILSAVVIMLQRTSGLGLLGFVALLAYNIYSMSKIKRCGIKITMSGCLLTDAIIFLACCTIFILVFRWGVGDTVLTITWWCINCALVQIITQLILDSNDKRKIKKLKNMQKQRKQYERKMNKIYGKQDNNK